MKDRPLVLGMGEIVWDCLPEGRKLGGAPVNFAYCADRMGADSYPVSAVGDDPLGVETLEACRSLGLKTSGIATVPFPTGRVLVRLDSSGIPEYDILENVAWDTLEAVSEVLELASRADAFCWGSLAQRSPHSREAIRRVLESLPSECLKVFDINLRQNYYSKEIIEVSLRFADILKLNEDEFSVLSDMFGFDRSQPSEAIPALAGEFGIRLVILTCGASFSEVFSSEGRLSHLPTPAVKVADTIGAGDSFTAAFVMSMLRGKSIAQAHATAVRVAAYVCTVPGAINPIPEELWH